MENDSYKSKYSGEQIEAMFDVVMSDRKEDKSNKTTKIDDSLNDKQYPSAIAVKTYVDTEIDNINDNLKDVEAVAKGRASGYVFDTVDDMNEWLANPDNVALLNLGDNFYIRDTNVPDYWWDTETQTVQELETQKVDLTEYVKTEEGKGLSTNDLTNDKNSVLENILGGCLVLDGGNGQKLYLYYDGISVVGGVSNLDLGGGCLENCTSANIEVLQYLNFDTGKWVNVQAAINGLNTNIGDIETALDNIIAIQSSLIGGES